jgi:MoaA/NifB/PqqE/SkfB family radical SAM enzyme
VSWRKDAAFAWGLARGRPFNVLVQVTNRCNLTCPFCDFWANGALPREELSVAEHQRVARELAGLGRFIVSIEGGEPFVRPDLPGIIAAYSERHLPVLYTNGWFVDDARAKAVFDAGITQVGVSIDYPDAARHDAKRGATGTWERAWKAVDRLRDAAPRGGRQVHVMTVLMDENQSDLEELLESSKARGVGHMVTLLSQGGFRRRKQGGEIPRTAMSERLLALHARYPHFRTFRDYLGHIDAFVVGGDLPRCRAGIQSFNIDHLGNVAACIEKIDDPYGNVRDEPLAEIHARMSAADPGLGCQRCWTLCRGTAQSLGKGAGFRGVIDLGTRLRSS